MGRDGKRVGNELGKSGNMVGNEHGEVVERVGTKWGASGERLGRYWGEIKERGGGYKENNFFPLPPSLPLLLKIALLEMLKFQYEQLKNRTHKCGLNFDTISLSHTAT